MPTADKLLYGLSPDWQLTTLKEGAARLLDKHLSNTCEARAAQRALLYDSVLPWIVQVRGLPRTAPAAQCHREWLMMPLPGLSGRTPREVLISQRLHIDRDLEYQQHNWISTNREPPGLPLDGPSYRSALFGSAEIIVYHRMVRELMIAFDSYFAHVRRAGGDTSVSRLAKWLTHQRDSWLQRPIAEYYDRSPAEIIEHERRRLPLVLPAEKLADCDCPICRMLASEGPLFWQLELPAYDEHFAFTFHETEQDWRREREQLAREFTEVEESQSGTPPS